MAEYRVSTTNKVWLELVTPFIESPQYSNLVTFWREYHNAEYYYDEEYTRSSNYI